MADSIVQKLEREFTIPLRRGILNAPRYDRTSKSLLRIREFIAKHMKVKNRSLENVKLDVHFNNFLWLKGRKSPPAKIKVKAVKDGETVLVTFAEVPKEVEFRKAKFAKLHKQSETPAEHKHDEHEGHDHKKEETAETKAEEKEKEKAVSEAHQKEVKQEAKAQKHVTKPEKVQHPQRMALQK